MCLRRHLGGSRWRGISSAVNGKLTAMFLGCVPAPGAAPGEALQQVMRGWWPQVERGAKDSRVRHGPDGLRWPNKGVQWTSWRFTLSLIARKLFTLFLFIFPKDDVCLLGLVWKLSETMVIIMINDV